MTFLTKQDFKIILYSSIYKLETKFGL